MNNKPIRPETDDHARIILAGRIVFVYFLTVLSVVGAIVYYKVPLTKQDFLSWPTPYLLVVWFLYYAVPLLLAILFGSFFRPFWKSFRNVLFAILTIQLVYSFTLSMFHWDAVEKLAKINSWKKSDRIIIQKFTPKLLDKDEDGYIDEIDIDAMFDLTRIRPGQYLLHGVIEPGATLSPYSIDGGGEFTIAKTSEENMIPHQFVIKPRSDLKASTLTLQTFQVKFLLFRIIIVGDDAKKMLEFSRWSPFLRNTDWNGNDQVLYSDMILLDHKVVPNVFIMRGPLVPKY